MRHRIAGKLIAHGIATALAAAAAAPATAQTGFPTGTGDHLLQGMMGMAGQFARQFQDSQMGPNLSQDLGQKLAPSGSRNEGLGEVPAGNSALGAVALNGAWRGSAGDYLLIEGQRFRLHPDSRRYIDGRVQIRGDLIAFYYPQRQSALVYRYSMSDDQLQLQDSQGRLLGYRRVPGR